MEFKSGGGEGGHRSRDEEQFTKVFSVLSSAVTTTTCSVKNNDWFPALNCPAFSSTKPLPHPYGPTMDIRSKRNSPRWSNVQAP